MTETTEWFAGHQITLRPVNEGGVLHGFIDGVDQGRVPNFAAQALSKMRNLITTGTAKTEPRFYVHDKKVSHLSTFSAVNPRYAVVDRKTNQTVDELQSKRAAQDTADFMNAEEN